MGSASTLLDRLSTIERQIGALGNLAQRRAEVVALQERKDKLQTALGDFVGQADRIRALQSGALELTMDTASIRRLHDRVGEVATAFLNKPDSQTLVANQRWTQLISAVQREGEKLKTVADAAWERFIVNECSAENPRTLGEKVPPTPENTQALARYTARFIELASQLRSGVQSHEDFRRIRASVASLQAELDAMHSDYPSELTDFLRAVMTPGGVPLSAVTPQLLELLREHDMLARYFVRGRS
jgi:hypothetical protein